MSPQTPPHFHIFTAAAAAQQQQQQQQQQQHTTHSVEASRARLTYIMANPAAGMPRAYSKANAIAM